MSREVAPSILFHANLGHAWDRNIRQGTTLWSLGVETATPADDYSPLRGKSRTARRAALPKPARSGVVASVIAFLAKHWGQPGVGRRNFAVRPWHATR